MNKLPVKKPLNFDIYNYVNDIHTFGIDVYKREIYLNGHISENAEGDPGVDYRSSSVFIKNMQILENMGRGKIKVIMNMDGGCWYSCMAMFDKIKSSKCFVEIVCFAHATSSSGIIFQAANKRVMMKNSHFMLHYGSVSISDSSLSASETIKYNDKECQKMLNIFAQRAVEGPFFRSKRWGVKKISEFLDLEMKKRGDFYLSAEEAVDFGFADEILGY